MAEKAPDRALQRIEQQIALAPQSGSLYEVLGELQLARKDPKAAEAAFLKAAELNPASSKPYVALAHIYVTDNRFDQALARVEQALKVKPDDIQSLMLSGMIRQSTGEIPKAISAYEKAIEVNPRFGPAANNLAYLYSEYGGDKEKALAMAQVAKEAMPEDPQVSDTLGWILYKRGVYEGALRLLSEKLPSNAEVQYHLGMAQAKMNQSGEAKQTLERALAMNSDFAGRDEAKKTLSQLN